MKNTILAMALITTCAAGCHGPERAQRRPDILNARSSHGLAYDLVGATEAIHDGPVVILIHGTNLDRRMWANEVTWMSMDAAVLTYDMRGQGGSEFPSEPYANHEDLLALLDELGIERASLVGLSAGAQVAVDVALEAPDRVERLVLVSPSLNGYRPEEMPPFLGDLMSALSARDFARANEVLIASPVMAVPAEHAGLVRTMVEENDRLWSIPYTLVKQTTPLAFDRLEEIGVPTLVLVGTEDQAAIRAQAELLDERVPRAKRTIIDGGGHLLNLTSPDEFRRAAGAFLNPSGR